MKFEGVIASGDAARGVRISRVEFSFRFAKSMIYKDELATWVDGKLGKCFREFKKRTYFSRSLDDEPILGSMPRREFEKMSRIRENFELEFLLARRALKN